MSCWNQDQTDRRKQKSILASPRGPFNKTEKNREVRLRTKICFTVNSPLPPSYTHLYLQLLIPDSPEYLLDPPSPNPAPFPQLILLISQTSMASPENLLTT